MSESVSVVMAVFNGGPFIEEALRSALSQEPAPLEIVVQDGGSTDDTAAVVAALGDPRISFVSEPDDGQSDALNRAIGRARGDWIFWLNADDVIAPGAFAAAAPFQEGADLVFGDLAYMREDRSVFRELALPDVFTRERLLTHNCYVFSGAMLIRRALFQRFGPLDETLRYAMDYDFFLRVAPEIRAVHCPHELGRFRFHSGSKTHALTWPVLRETAMVRRRHGAYRSAAVALPVLANQLRQVGDVITAPVRRAPMEPGARWGRI